MRTILPSSNPWQRGSRRSSPRVGWTIRSGLVQDFATQIRKELDFTRDGRNAERMARNFRDVPGIHFPKIYWDYSSSRLLVMEYVRGVRIDNVEAITAQGCDTHDIAVRGFNAYLKMILRTDFSTATLTG